MEELVEVLRHGVGRVTKLKYWEKNTSQNHFVHHKSYMDWYLGLKGSVLIFQHRP
jgi:hypothetical protein